jgi:dTMP kinase
VGRFVVIEGIDGAGTTTQARRLVERLRARGEEVVATNEPTDLPVGVLIRRVLRKEEGAPDPSALPWMFAADRADHLARRVRPALARGAWVVSDRYLPSSLAYQSLQRPLDEVEALNAAFEAPDVLVFVDVPVDVALARVAARGAERELFEEAAWLTRVVRQYHLVMERLAARGWRVVHVDGSQDLDAVEAAVREAVGC